MGTFLPAADADTVEGAADVELTRWSQNGDTAATEELWRRHYRHALAATSALTGSPDVQMTREGFTDAWRAIIDGARPRGAFRAFLLARIAARGSASTPASPSAEAVLAAEAYGRLLPDQQELLWYAEIEGMTAEQIAPLVRLTPTGVAALTGGARQELARAWAKPHIDAAPKDSPCRSAGEGLVALVVGSPAAGAEPTENHLAVCDDCAALAADARSLRARLRTALPAAVIGTAAAAYLETVRGKDVPAADIPPLPAAIAMAAAGGFAGSAGARGWRTGHTAGAERLVGTAAASAAIRWRRRGAPAATPQRQPGRTHGIPSPLAVTAVVVTGALVAGAFVLVSDVTPPLTPQATQSLEGDTDAPRTRTDGVPEDPAPAADTLLPGASSPPAAGVDAETAPSTPGVRSVVMRDAFLPPVSSPSGPSPAPAIPPSGGTSARPAGPAAPSTGRAPATSVSTAPSPPRQAVTPSKPAPAVQKPSQPVKPAPPAQPAPGKPAPPAQPAPSKPAPPAPSKPAPPAPSKPAPPAQPAPSKPAPPAQPVAPAPSRPAPPAAPPVIQPPVVPPPAPRPQVPVADPVSKPDAERESPKSKPAPPAWGKPDGDHPGRGVGHDR